MPAVRLDQELGIATPALKEGGSGGRGPGGGEGEGEVADGGATQRAGQRQNKKIV